MPASTREKPLYQRGEYRLDRRAGRSNLVITWYDNQRGRERGASARTSDVREGRKALDRLYLERSGGGAVCPTCGGMSGGATSSLVTTAIADYLLLSEHKASHEAIAARLAHVITYIATLNRADIYCNAIDEAWIARFRTWLEARPIVSVKGKILRERSLSTVENSVMQLAAAINAAYQRRDTPHPPRFKPIQIHELNRSPQYRADVAMIGRMFAYALEANRGRENLLGFLRISLVTLARPDAAHDVSVDPKREQWNAEHRILDLNPLGRRQTRKYRAKTPIPRQAARILEDARENSGGFVVPVGSIRSAWEAMAKEIGLPGDRQAGTKLVRRSVAKIMRDRLGQEPSKIAELEIMLGHRRIDSVSELYAPFDPSYCASILAEIEALIEEIEDLAPGAFYRDLTAQRGNVTPIARAKKR